MKGGAGFPWQISGSTVIPPLLHITSFQTDFHNKECHRRSRIQGYHKKFTQPHHHAMFVHPQHLYNVKATVAAVSTDLCGHNHLALNIPVSFRDSILFFIQETFIKGTWQIEIPKKKKHSLALNVCFKRFPSVSRQSALTSVFSDMSRIRDYPYSTHETRRGSVMLTWLLNCRCHSQISHTSSNACMAMVFSQLTQVFDALKSAVSGQHLKNAVVSRVSITASMFNATRSAVFSGLTSRYETWIIQNT